MSDGDKGILMLLGLWLITGAGLAYDSHIKPPKNAYNMAQYEIHYQRCLGGPKATVEACHDVAKFKSLTCVGCQ